MLAVTASAGQVGEECLHAAVNLNAEGSHRLQVVTREAELPVPLAPDAFGQSPGRWGGDSL